MVRFLLDTNILSEPLRPQPNLTVIQRLTDQGEELSTASIVYHEMLLAVGACLSRRQQTIIAYLQRKSKQTDFLPYDAAANWHAAERAGLVHWANRYLDGQIAAIAVVNDLILVTNNTSDYADFQNLQLQNWFIPIRSLFMPVTSDIVQKLWNLCHVLRDDGITHLLAIFELTYLLFLK